VRTVTDSHRGMETKQDHTEKHKSQQ
jgi:hypothetical protein